MDGITAVVVIGTGLVLTLLVGIASQLFGRVSVNGTRVQSTAPPSADAATQEQEEDMEALKRSIEEAREELLWLRDQVARERIRLEGVRRQVPPQQAPRPGMPHAAPPSASLESPWIVLGLAPGSSTEEIRRRYRLLSRVWHPDRFTDGPAELRAEAELMMARLNRAHTAVTNQTVGGRR